MGMTNEEAIRILEEQRNRFMDEYVDFCGANEAYSKAIDLLKSQEGLLGICQTADGITFISTGTAQEGEKRGIMFGKKLMHEWLYKELLCKDLLTDEIRSVFEQAESI